MTVRLGVYLLDSTLAFDRLYDYLAEETAAPEGQTFRRGMFVIVPFGKGNIPKEAVVWNVSPLDGALDGGVGLKTVVRAESDEPLSEAEFDFAFELCENYACTPGTAIRSIRPFREKKKAVSRTVEAAELTVSREEAKKIADETALRSIYQIKILEELSARPGKPCEDVTVLLRETGAIRVHLKKLAERGYIRIIQREAGPDDVAPAVSEKNAADPMLTYPEHELNAQQAEAFRAVKESVDGNKPETFLLHGITGSGKTEVYMHLISHVLGIGGSVMMMVPEISLTPQMISHFTSRFGENVAVWHSALTPAMREREWYRMKKGIARVAVSTRSGIFAPLENVKLVIIDEAHDGSYRSEESGLRYDTSEVAGMRFGKTASILLGSATPGVTAYYRALKGEMKLLTLTERAGQGRLPSMTVADMREERGSLAQGSVFSSVLKKALCDNYARGDQAMLFVGRRGFSSRLFCRECGKAMICSACGLSMTYHAKAKRLLCSYCGKTAPAPEKCPSCGSPHLGFGSAGTERVEEELKKMFPEAEVLRMDSDTVKGTNGHATILKRFRREKVPFLVGTQMITKGHDFPGVNLVGIIDADGQINQPEYNAGEKAFQILSQVAGRAGRDSAAGEVIIQTYSVDDRSLKAAVDGDYAAFYENEIRFRRAMIYPPFCSLASIRVSGKNDREVYDCLTGIASSMRAEAKDGTLVLGPSREAVPKIDGRYRWQLTLKGGNRKELVALFLRVYGTIKLPGGMRISAVFEN